MIRIRKAEDRGVTKIGWLDGRHTFSFGDYYDPDHLQYRTLRVINDDRVAPGGGFPTHPHRDMEILTYIIDGQLQHRDSMGNGTIIRAGEWQKMSAGTGIQHSEFNPSQTEPVHLLQIWIVPNRKGITPEYDQKLFPLAEQPGVWHVVASPDGREGSIRLHQDATLLAARLNAGQQLWHTVANGRGAWLHVVRGEVTVNDHTLREGDAAAVENEKILIGSNGDGEVMLFDLA